MYHLKDSRLQQQNYWKTLEFNNISVYGNFALKKDIPDVLRVSVVPSSLKRMLDAWDALQNGLSVSGTKIRSYDVKSPIPEHDVEKARLLLTESKPYYTRIELQCICSESARSFSSFIELPNTWFLKAKNALPKKQTPY